MRVNDTLIPKSISRMAQYPVGRIASQLIMKIHIKADLLSTLCGNNGVPYIPVETVNRSISEHKSMCRTCGKMFRNGPA